MVPSNNPHDGKVWPIGLLCVLLLFAATMTRMVYLAGHGFEGPDNVQYYREGLEFSKEIKRQALQKEMAWQVSKNLPKQVASGQSLPVGVDVHDCHGLPLDGIVQIDIGHPATRLNDQHLKLSLQKGHAQTTWTTLRGVWDFRWTIDADNRRWTGKSRLIVAP